MTAITLKGNAIHTCGELPKVGAKAPAFKLTAQDLKEVSLQDFAGKKKVINIFPSVDTPVCALSQKTFVSKAAGIANTVVLNISADLPFAQKRFCAAEGVEGAVTLSCFRGTFAQDWGVQIIDSPLAGLCSRAVVVLDANDTVIYTEQVPEIAQEPNYEKALAALK